MYKRRGPVSLFCCENEINCSVSIQPYGHASLCVPISAYYDAEKRVESSCVAWHFFEDLQLLSPLVENLLFLLPQNCYYIEQNGYQNLLVNFDVFWTRFVRVRAEFVIMCRVTLTCRHIFNTFFKTNSYVLTIYSWLQSYVFLLP